MIKNISKKIFANILNFLPGPDIYKNVYLVCKQFKFFVEYYDDLYKLKFISFKFYGILLRDNQNLIQKIFKNIYNNKCLCELLMTFQKCFYCRTYIEFCDFCGNGANHCDICKSIFCNACWDHIIEKPFICDFCHKLICPTCIEENDSMKCNCHPNSAKIKKIVEIRDDWEF